MSTLMIARETRRESYPLVALSATPTRKRLAPKFTTELPSYSGVFEPRYAYVVNLHANGTYDLAKDVIGLNLELYLEHETGNEHDANAIKVFVGKGGDFLGYLDAETAAAIVDELNLGAPLYAKATAGPWGGRQSRGGQVEILVELKD
jgi:hypothetical protein